MRYGVQVAARCGQPICALAPGIKCTVIIQTEAFYCFSVILMLGPRLQRSDASTLYTRIATVLT